MKGTAVDELTSTEVGGRPNQDTRCERVVSRSVGPDGLSFRSEPGPLRLEDCGMGSRYGFRSSSFCLVVLLASEKKRKDQVRQDC